MKTTRATIAVALFVLGASPAAAQSAAPADAIDKAVSESLAASGAPAASVAVVRDGRIVLAKAYGKSHLAPDAPATAGQRFAIGSVSKQFTAAAVLLLVEDGKVSLDDKVGEWIPGLTAGDRITVRQILSHTSGYRDYWPQDFIPPYMQRPATPQQILDRFARVPLDFEPGDQWQYSNTGFVAAGLIVEKASGQPLMDFLQARIFRPLGMASATDIDKAPLPAADAQGYTRYALGPVRPSPKEGPGWLFGAGQLAMTASDLARWDIARIERKLLKPASWREMETSIRLNNGRDARYGLGVTATSDGQLRLVSHGGAVSGYLAENRVWPDVGAAVVVLVDGDFGDPGQIAGAINQAMPLASRPSDAETARAKAFFEVLRQGRVDAAAMTEAGRSFFTPEVLQDYAGSLAGLGPLKGFTPLARGLRGGFSQEVYLAAFEKQRVQIVARAVDGKYEQFIATPD
jgi:CubicO group peptidase (beta-lactamase class C family)